MCRLLQKTTITSLTFFLASLVFLGETNCEARRLRDVGSASGVEDILSVTDSQCSENLNGTNGIQVGPSGNFYINGNSCNAAIGSQQVIRTNAYSSLGTLLWSRILSAPSGYWIGTYRSGAASQTLAVDRTENVIVAGFRSMLVSNAKYEGLVAKYDPSGNLLWQVHFPASSVSGYLFNAVQVDDQNNIYLGASYIPSIYNTTQQITSFIKLDPNGNILWEKNLEAGSVPWGTNAYAGIAVSSFGIYVSAYVSSQFTLAKLDLASGNLIWQVPINSSQVNQPILNGIGLFAEGNEAIYLKADGNGLSAGTILKFSSGGVFLKRVTLGAISQAANGSAAIGPFAIDANGNIYGASGIVTGFERNGMGGPIVNLFSAKFDPNGALLSYRKLTNVNSGTTNTAPCLSIHGSSVYIGGSLTSDMVAFKISQ